ncbi:MAG: FtsX-like permease family protein [Oscillospiraceae bacterium]|nr:FtsX-like permease family protein [Oscillospiraceae bacterium]
MKNPLTKRLPRSLKSDFGKYAVIFIFITGMIAFVSGFLVASHSMRIAYDDSFTTYNIEDGNLEFTEKPSDEILDEIADGKLRFYENYYKEESLLEKDSTLRIFAKRTEIDLECLMSGAFPAADDEIAIDRLYAENNNFAVGDTLRISGHSYRISGLVALSDYSALFSSPANMMFDAIKFGVAIVTDDAFAAIRDVHLHYSYSWKWNTPPANDKAKKDASDDLLDRVTDVLKANAEDEAEALVTEAIQNGQDPSAVKMPDFLSVNQYIPAYSNQAIIFTGSDISGDAMMFLVFLYILVAIIAFVMAITTSNTITQEATVIGTLRASGYTRGELIRHFMLLPAVITLIGAVIGNVLGYTLLKERMAGIYYRSYCLTTYKTVWNADAFIETTVMPVILMLLINYLVIRSKMHLSPLRFMRGDLSTSKRKKAFKLNTKIPILHRFRLRVFFQNIPNYIVLLFGLFLADIILLFGVMFTPILNEMGDNITEHMIADYQYVLKTPEDTEISGAEQYNMTSLRTPADSVLEEDVSIYGFEPDSRYAPAMPEDPDSVIISNCYAEKHHVAVGDTVTLHEQYGDGVYSFRVSGIVYYPAGLAMFMEQKQFRNTFDLEDDAYTGYLSDEPLTDLTDDNIAAQITADDMTKVSRQLISSMGGIASGFKVFGVIMFVLMIYLLSKIIIERNSQAISMVKILGYSGGEINSLYVFATTVVVILGFVVSLPLCDRLMEVIIHLAMSRYPGWFEYHTQPKLLVCILLLGILSYAVVAVLLLHKIKRIPMSDALKSQE